MVATSLLGCGIYRILNLVNGKFYLGSSIERVQRRYDHLWALRAKRHCNYRLQADFNIYGEAAFVFEAVESVDDPANLLKAEQWWIDDSRCYEEDIGYNISPTAGSTLGKAQTEETKDKIRQKALGRVWSEEAVAKLTATFALPEHKERMASWYRSEETRSKVSLSKGGSGYVLNLDDIAKAIVIYEAGDISIRKVSAAFDVSYQQMRSALMAIGPKFGEERQVYEPIKTGNTANQIASKISKTLRKVPEGLEDRVREKYLTGQYTQLALADEFNVGPEVIHRIIKASSFCFGQGEVDAIQTIRHEKQAGPKTHIPDDIVDEIREMYASGNYTQHDLRKTFGVPRSTIGRIINGEGYYKFRDKKPVIELAPGLMPVRVPVESVWVPVLKMTPIAQPRLQQTAFQF